MRHLRFLLSMLAAGLIVSTLTVRLVTYTQGRPPASGGPLAPDKPIAKGYNDAAKALATADDNPMINWIYNVWCVTGYRDAYPGDDVEAPAHPDDLMTPHGFLLHPVYKHLAGQFMDNAWLFGTDFLGSVIVKVPEGLLVFDTMTSPEEFETNVITEMKKAGLNPADIKYVFMGHQHIDHIGGANLIRHEYAPQSKFVMSKLDGDAVAAMRASAMSGTPEPGRGGRGSTTTTTTPAQQQAARLQALPDKVDILVPTFSDMGNGMQKITIGPSTSVIAVVVPGHTIGQTAFIVPTMYKGQPHKLAIWSGNDVKPVAALGGTVDPANARQYAASFDFFLSVAQREGVDSTINVHPYQGNDYQLLRKFTANPNMPNPFILGRDGIDRLYGVMGLCNRALERRVLDGTWKSM